MSPGARLGPPFAVLGLVPGAPAHHVGVLVKKNPQQVYVKLRLGVGLLWCSRGHNLCYKNQIQKITGRFEDDKPCQPVIIFRVTWQDHG